MIYKMLRRLLGFESGEWPPEKPPVYGCDTLEEHMEAAAWDIKLHGLKGRHAEAMALFDSLFVLGEGDMTECTRVMLDFPELAPLAFVRRDDLAARGVNVDSVHAEMEDARMRRVAAECGATLSSVAMSFDSSLTDRR